MTETSECSVVAECFVRDEHTYLPGCHMRPEWQDDESE